MSVQSKFDETATGGDDALIFNVEQGDDGFLTPMYWLSVRKERFWESASVIMSERFMN